MPADGVDILEGVASRCTCEEIGPDLKIDANLVRVRLHRMRMAYRARLEKLGLRSNVTPLHVLVATPGALDLLRTVA
jgi:hypothetical protein